MSRFQALNTAFAGASPAWVAAATWTRERSRREQVLIAFFGGFLVLTLFWFAVPRPLLEARAAAIDRIEAYAAIQARLSGSAVAGPAATLADGPLPAALTAQASSFGLTPSVTGDGETASVTLSAVSYESLIRWIGALESSGAATVRSLRITRGATEGMVDATMSVTRA